ncbi:MAG: penicillin-binding protein, partial [bacterium]|nr:penicillin-binding protein [bacterium]
YQTEFGNQGKGLSELTKDKIKALNLEGIDFVESQKRYYPKGDFLSYTLGYAKMDAEGKITGELGIEALFNDSLTGTDGFKEYQKDLRGYKIANTDELVQEAKDGNDIYLTIDSNVQFFLEQALENAADQYLFDQINIIVAEAKTGKILGLSTTPSFDPNIRNIENYLDPNISVAIEPGSTMKIFSYMAIMESGKYNGEETFKSGIYTTSDGTEIGDWNRRGWGDITYDKGFALSSNVGIVNLIDKYIDRNILKDYYKKIGFGSKTGIELSKETSGKLDFKYETEVFNAGFGQGIMTTSIQNIKALTAIANDGILLKPYIVDKVVDSSRNVIVQNSKTEIERVASKDTTDKIKDLMEQVVLDGTGSPYYMEGYGLIAKTGTAQIASTNGTGYLKGENDVIRGFAGMFPKEDPEIIIYANLKRPNPNTPNALVDVVQEVVTNVSKYYNIYDETVTSEEEIRYELANYMNQDVRKVVNTLEKNGISVVVIGDGTRVIEQYPNCHLTIPKGSKVFLNTEGKKLVLEDMTGWSKKDVLAYLDLLGISFQYEGTGYLTSQSLEAGIEVVENMNLELVFEPKYSTE